MRGPYVGLRPWFQRVAARPQRAQLLRLLLLALTAVAGFRLGGAVLAAVASGIASAALAVALIRKPLRRGARAARPALGPFLRYLWPVVVGLIGIALLTNVDLLLVKARFSDGTVEDVTRWARYTSGDETVAEVGDTGLVKMQGYGETAINVSYLSQVAPARVTESHGSR